VRNNPGINFKGLVYSKHKQGVNTVRVVRLHSQWQLITLRWRRSAASVTSHTHNH